MECAMSMLKTWYFLFLLGALLGLSGCPDQTCVADGGVPSTPSSSPPPPSLVLVGEQVSLRVSPAFLNTCGTEALESPSRLAVEVYGPDNLLVENQATLGNPATSRATVKFTPEEPGRYHIFAAFEPVGGIQQFDLYAAKDRSSEAPAFGLPKLCNSLERTQRGGWLCDLDFIRDGAVAQHFTSGRAAVAGNVVWMAGSSQVQRYVDTGTALELTASMSSSVSGAEFLLASETELIALRGLTVERITYDGTATLRMPGSVQLPSISGKVGTTGLWAVLVRSGDQLGVITNAPSTGGVQPPNRFTNQICAYRIEPARILRTAEPCQTFSGMVVGYEPDVLWVGEQLFEGTLEDLRRLEWTGTGLAEQASLPLGFNFRLPTQPLSSRNQVVPVVSTQVVETTLRTRSTVAVYSPARRTLLLELLDDELASPYVSSTLLWTNPNATGQTPRVRIRPTAP